MRQLFESVQTSKVIPSKNLWVFTPTTLWLLATEQFNVIRASAGNDFCLILSKEDQRYRKYYEKLFCFAFKKFDAHIKLSISQANVTKVKLAIPPTRDDARFDLIEAQNTDAFLLERKETHSVHIVGDHVDHDVLANTKTQDGYVCRALKPQSKRGKFDTDHLREMHDTIKRRYDSGELTKLVIALDLDDTTIKLEGLQPWCLGMNFFNPEALHQIREFYEKYKNQFEIRILAITARSPGAEKKAPSYFHAHHLLDEFLKLVGIPEKCLAEKKQGGVFYTSPAEKDVVVSPKYNKLRELYGKESKTFVVLFDNDPSNWSGENPHPHLHYVAVENWYENDLCLSLVAQQARSLQRSIPRRPPTPHPQERVVAPQVEETPSSVNNPFSASEEKPSSRFACCAAFFQKVRKLCSSASPSSQSLAQTHYHSYNNEPRVE